MGDTKPHVEVIDLWRYTCGTVNLPEDEFEHLLICIECQSLVSQFIDVLEQLPRSHSSPAA
jgi:hypothetical protein